MTRLDVRCEPTTGGWRCTVEADDGRTAGRHVVTVANEDAERLAVVHDQTGVERLVDETFRFLLEREPRASVLATFDITVVSRYFPDFDDEIGHRLGT